MSDRSALTLIVYGCPDEERDDVLDVINQYGLSEGYGLGDGGDVQSIELGSAYGVEEARIDTYSELSAALITRAPGCTFSVWNDPKYEYLGGLVMFAPGLGSFTHDCDSDGNPVFTSAEVNEAIAMTESDYLDQFLGKPWLDRMKVEAA